MATIELIPCPWCGAGTTQVKENGRVWLGMRYGEPSSVSIQHWCEPIEGQPSRMIERVGRDLEAACAAWNTRYFGRGENVSSDSSESIAPPAPDDS